MSGAYIGKELEIFAHAKFWKRYWTSRIGPWIHGDVAEVGAGIGANTEILRTKTAGNWTCIEPDPGLASRLKDSARTRQYVVHEGTLFSLPSGVQFDTVLYADVLEHIADDRRELEVAGSRLNRGGHLIVVAPAHQWLFTPFDVAIGHHRRYTRAALSRITPPGSRLVVARYLDSVGLLASAANRLVLRQSMPSRRQILLWDRCMVPVSRVVDGIVLGRLGKSVFAIWERFS